MTPQEKAQEYAESCFPKEIPDYNKVTRMYAEHAYLAGYNADRWIPIEAIPYQRCPICDGSGQTVADMYISGVFQTCKCCNGAMIIPMYTPQKP